MENYNNNECIVSIVAIVCIINEYYESNINKIQYMTFTYIGEKWICELLTGHPNDFITYLKYHS